MRFVLVEFDAPFYRPLWRRVAVLAVVSVWSVVEFLAGSTGWGAFTAIVAAYLAWGFFIAPAMKPSEPPKPEP